MPADWRITATSGTFSAANLRFYLATILDHLPVAADYQIPAKMGVNVGSVAMVRSMLSTVSAAFTPAVTA